MQYTKIEIKTAFLRKHCTTVPVQNFAWWNKWFCENHVFEQTAPLFAHNFDYFNELFGDPSCYLITEHRFACWLLDLNKAQIVLLTAKRKGTCYEVVFAKDNKKVQKDQQTLLDFFEWLIHRLEKNNL